MRLSTTSLFQLTTSRRGRQALMPCIHHSGSFNSRPHEEVDICPLARDNSACAFQLTTSRRGRRYGLLHQPLSFYVSTHDLTKRSTCRLLEPCADRIHSFNSRPHEEVDLIPQLNRCIRIRFNSRPHEEVDLSTTKAEDAAEEFQLTTSRRGRLSL